MQKTILQKITEFYEIERLNFALWITVLICLGSYFSVILFDKINFANAALSFFLTLFGTALYFRNKNSFSCLIFGAFVAILFGFTFSYFNQKISRNYNEITGKVFSDIEGEVAQFSHFYNKKNGKEGLNLLLKNVTLYKSEFTRKKSKKKKRKIRATEKYIHKNFMNVGDLQTIDNEFLKAKKNYQNVDWQKNGDRFLYPNPPKKIRLFVTKYRQKIKVGDKVFLKAIILPYQKTSFIGDFDFGFYSLSKGIGGQGYGISELKITQKSRISSLDNFFVNLRKKIQQKILKASGKNQKGVINALLTGDRKSITQDQAQHIRNSGLAHLIAISGLHLSLSAAIFFFAARFLLLQSHYLTLNFNIKKIAAIIAIFASFFYLKIAGSPISGQRAFLMILFVMLAILLDKKVNPLRCVAFAGLAIILISPYNMFFASFQLSFAAVLAIISFHQIWQNFYKNKFEESAKNPNFIHKSSKYIFEMMLVSCAAQIANVPFLIYHFSDVAIYGLLSNIIAVPLTSFVIMPLGFSSFFLMPFGLEKLALIPMSYFTQFILQIAEFVSGLKNSHLYIANLPKSGFILAVIGGLFFAFFKNKYLRILGIILFLSSLFTVYFVKEPKILIDKNASFFALYNKEKGLVFSKKMRESKKVKLWIKKMNDKEFKYFDKKSNYCNKKFCEINLGKYFKEENMNKKTMLVLLKRNKNRKICSKKYSLIINLTKKYSLPKCAFQGQVIDSIDILKKGAHFIYFTKNGDLKIKNS